MNIFAPKETFRCGRVLSADCLEKLPEVIRRHTGWSYASRQRDGDCRLTPTFRNMPYRNSFVPELEIAASHHGAQTELRISGRPVRSVRVFLAVWMGFLSALELLLVLLAAASRLEDLFLMLIPPVMCGFGYLLCEAATRMTFRSIVKAIKEELS